MTDECSHPILDAAMFPDPDRTTHSHLWYRDVCRVCGAEVWRKEPR